MRLKQLCLAALVVLLPAPAQDAAADKGYLAALLEENLSGAGRQVTIDGFSGALSSRATIDRLTIADDQGIWLTLSGITLDWSRSALLAGVLDVSELSARDITLTRLPAPQPATPSPEAQGFSLPDLPVSVTIGRLAADHFTLGPAVLGEPVEARLQSSLLLAGGAGHAEITLERTDNGPSGRLALRADYANATQELSLNLTAAESAGGLVVRKLGLPGAPDATLSVQGAGPLDAFAADIALATSGVDRLSGRVTLNATPTGNRAFRADLSGDLAPLVLPQYAAFFGPEIRLSATGQGQPDGGFLLQGFDLTAQAVHLSGKAEVGPDALPRRLSLQGRIGLPDGSPVLLPIPGQQDTRLASADLSVGFNAALGTGWRGRIAVNGLDRADFAADLLILDGNGTLTAATSAAPAAFDAAFRFAAQGLRPADPALAAALGPAVTGRADLHATTGGKGLELRALTLNGADYALSASGLLSDPAQGLRVSGTANLRADSITRFSALAARPLSGAATIAIRGEGTLLGGDFDLATTLTGQNLTLAQPQADRLLDGTSRIALSLRRDTTGTTIRALTVTASTLSLSAKGTATSNAMSLDADLSLSDLSSLDPAFGGSLSGRATFAGRPDDGRITLSATGQSLRTGQPQADRLFAGTTALDLALGLSNGRFTVETATLSNPQLTAKATGTATATRRDVALTAQLANLGLFLPDFPGTARIEGTASESGGDYRLDLRATGPGKISATVSGTMARDAARADLAITGGAQAGLLTPFLSGRVLSGPVRFDLSLNGPLALSSLGGRVSLSGGRLSDPRLAFGLDALSLDATLASGRARIAANTRLTSGGTVTANGGIALAAPFDADLAITLSRAILRDPRLYQTVVDGTLALTGPLTGGALISGQLALGQTELRIPSTGFGGNTDLTALSHLNEPADVRATRARAGLTGGTGTATSTRPLRLDLAIAAPSQIFIRGRGLDAELGGQLVLRGTTANIQPAGTFTLIRGRLDILGRRLVLTEASLLLTGDFIPTLAVAAATESDGITTTVRIDGPATGPDVSFTSSPELPEEEVLARLLFGRGLENLSPVQAAQLANAVATLAGREGLGLIGRLRQGFGLDDFDVQTDATGATSLTVGKYLAKNLYTEVAVAQNGQSQINLNLDVSPSLTLRGSAGGSGQAGIGIFFERDY